MVYATYVDYATKKINQVVDSLTSITINECVETEYRLEAARIIAVYLDDVINWHKNKFQERVDM